MDYSILLAPGTCFFFYMTALWLLGLRTRNAGLVDFGWPSGFTALAVYFALASEGDWKRRLLISLLYGICGLRFMVGWIVRNLRDGEDRRWDYWRQYWRAGNSRLGIRSTAANLFIFYHTQTFATLLVLIVPLVLACGNSAAQIHMLECVGVGIWFFALLMENVADFQLDQFRRNPRGQGVCRTGLWKFSRHPNYFFEFVIWVGYAVFAWPSASNVVEYGVLLLVPLTAYWFLVHFTGIPITEAASRARRGEVYARYQEETNRFFPWFPAKEDQTDH